jgi:hypothetical protein
MGTATLPVQAVITGSVGSSASLLKFKSASVQTEGQGLREMPGIINSTVVYDVATSGSGGQNNILTIRPKLLYKGRRNTCTLIIDEIIIGNDSSSFGGFYYVLVNPIQDPPFAGPLPIVFRDINTNNSAFEVSDSAYSVELNPLFIEPDTIIIASGPISPSTTIQIKFDTTYPITLNRAGVHRGLGTIGIFGGGGGNSLEGSIRFREFR